MNTRARLVVILSCGIILAALALVAQDIPTDEIFWASKPYAPEVAAAPAIRVQSDLVEVATVVRDNHEKAVGGLKKENFLLFDNGKPQTISTFSILAGAENSASAAPGRGSEVTPVVQPRYVALFFDDLNTGMANLNFAREAAIKFIQKGLDLGEKVGIFTASGTLSLDFTDDVKGLLDILAKLRKYQRPPDQGPGACPRLDTYQAWVIVHLPGLTDELRTAIALARGCCGPEAAESCAVNAAHSLVQSAEDYSLDTLHSITFVIRHLGQMRGQRVLLFASPGFLTLSMPQEQQKVIEAALRVNVVINTLDTAGVVWAGKSKYYLRTPLSDMAEGTGGTFMHNNNDLAGGMRTLSAAPSVSYLLGFSPANLKVDGSEHKLKVKMAEKNHLSVSARPGYYAPSPEPTSAEKRFRKLQSDVMASNNPTEIPIQFTATPKISSAGEKSLKILVHVDVRKLPFQDIGDRKAERLIFITALFDERDQFLTGVEGVMDLRLKDATLKQVSAQGLEAKLSIQASAGSYRVRQVVQEAVSGRVAAVNRMVEIR
jgi:VWFA-related protein